MTTRDVLFLFQAWCGRIDFLGRTTSCPKCRRSGEDLRQSHVSQLITLCEELAHRHQRMPDAAEFWDDEARALSWDLASIRASIR